MKRHVLLVNPWIYDFAAYDFWLAPQGLLSLAAFLRKNGYHIQLIDCLRRTVQIAAPRQGNKGPRRFPTGHGHFSKEPIPKPHPIRNIPKQYSRYGISEIEFLNTLKSIEKPDLILVTSTMTYWYPAIFDTIRILKQHFPPVPILLGGIYATICPEHAQNAGADLIIPGEGEPQLPKILKDVLGDDISFEVDASNMDTYPYPAYDLFERIEQISIMSSKGCPFRCTYCASHRLNPEFRRRDPIKVADEISYWHKALGINHFSFYDDALLVDPKEMAVPLLKEIIRRTPDCSFHCPNGLHLREVNPELARLMFKAGFLTIRFGFETADKSIQQKTGGKVVNEHLDRAVAYLKEAGYDSKEIGIYLLCGLPGQSADTVREAVEHVIRCGARPIIAEYSPIPGTSLWKASLKASVYPIADEPLFQNNTLLPCQSELLTYEMYQDLKRMTRMS